MIGIIRSYLKKINIFIFGLIKDLYTYIILSSGSGVFFMSKNCANKDKSISPEKKAIAATLHNFHYAFKDRFIPQNEFNKHDYFKLVVYCGLHSSFVSDLNKLGFIYSMSADYSNEYKILRSLLIRHKILNRKKGWNISRIEMLHTIFIVKTSWIDNDFLERISR